MAQDAHDHTKNSIAFPFVQWQGQTSTLINNAFVFYSSLHQILACRILSHKSLCCPWARSLLTSWISIRSYLWTKKNIMSWYLYGDKNVMSMSCLIENAAMRGIVDWISYHNQVLAWRLSLNVTCFGRVWNLVRQVYDMFMYVSNYNVKLKSYKYKNN